MQKFEQDYIALIDKILSFGEIKEGRNGYTTSIFGEQLKVPLYGNKFPLLNGRNIFYKGVFGELAAMLRCPTHIDDFKKWGCNYWDSWANEDGDLAIDYGNAWFQDGQVEHLKECLLNNPNDRRMIINGWRPSKLKDLSLPCCHYSYQFHVDNDGFINMVWVQRSVDVMIGLPSDIVFAAAWLISLANEFGYKPGMITMQFGDTHIYSKHLDSIDTYVCHAMNSSKSSPIFEIAAEAGKDFTQFEPSDIVISNYEDRPVMKFELIA